MNKHWFLQLKEQRLDALIRGGLLRQTDARSKLVAFTQTVRRVLGASVLPRKVVILTLWAFVALC